MTDLLFAKGERNAGFLRTEYQGLGAAKRIARDLECSISLAKKLLQGHPPSAEVFDRMVHRYGPKYLGWIYQPIGAWADRMLAESEQKQLEERLSAVKARLDNLGDTP